MENKIDKITKITLSASKLHLFYINHLNRIYCAKSHLRERLPEIQEHAHFIDLYQAITETLSDVEKQISRMDKIYKLLTVEPDFDSCNGIIGLIEDTFSAIHEQSNEPEMRDLSILFYLQNIESIEMASFKMLKLTATGTAKKKIRDLLKENFDEACKDLALLQLITAKYFKSTHVRNQ
jgi:ferritin-like metal-binding protein YciE